MHLIPSPRFLAAPLRLLPEPLLRHGSARVIAHVLATPLAEGMQLVEPLQASAER